MKEQTLYSYLLKGAIIGSLPYADSLARTFSRMIENGKIEQNNKPQIYPELIFYYGDMLEGEEEEELDNLLNKDDNQTLCNRLIQLENDYEEYFLSLISERREKVERVYQDVINRTNTPINDDEVLAIKKAESLNLAHEVGAIWKKIVRSENDAIKELYRATYSRVNYDLYQNSGNEDDTADVWSKAQTEFRRKLNKTPDEKGYYQWRPNKNKLNDKTSIYTFFIGICKKRWLDVLREKKKINDNQQNILTEYYQEYYDNEIDKMYEQELLKNKINTALNKLLNPCKAIIEGKWFGGQFGEGLSSKELAEQIPYTVGTIDNRHKGCLDELRIILNS